MGQRISSHKVETNTKDNVRNIINSGNFLIRELSGRDYGIDAIIECFDGKNITGKIAFIQFKGTANHIKPLKTKPVISCQISTSNAYYARQTNIPVMLIYSSLKSKNSFYYIFLQEVEFDKNKLEKQNTITIHIPSKNIIVDDPKYLGELIDKYY